MYNTRNERFEGMMTEKWATIRNSLVRGKFFCSHGVIVELKEKKKLYFYSYTLVRLC